MCLPVDDRTIVEDEAGAGESGAPTNGGAAGTAGNRSGGSGGSAAGTGDGGDAGGPGTGGSALGGTGGDAGADTGGTDTGGANTGGTDPGGSGGSTTTGGIGGAASGSGGMGGKAGAATGIGGTSGAGAGGGGSGGGGPVPVVIGWASVAGYSVTTTTGAGNQAPTQTVTTATDFSTAIAGNDPRVVRLMGNISGTFNVGANKTIEGVGGATITGTLFMGGSQNVIVRNLRFVGYNCMSPDPPTCSDGTDAITIRGNGHHIWIDHADISDGSDSNLDITEGADLITVSWTKFHFSTARAGGHRHGGLIGASDNSPMDVGKLRVTFHHSYWSTNVQDVMPLARYGLVHLFNNLYDATGNDACIVLGVEAKILVQNSVFNGINDPFFLGDASTSSALVQTGNMFTGCTGNMTGQGATAFTPPYMYNLDSTGSVPGLIANNVGPR